MISFLNIEMVTYWTIYIFKKYWDNDTLDRLVSTLVNLQNLRNGSWDCDNLIEIKLKQVIKSSIPGHKNSISHRKQIKNNYDD